MLWRKILHSFKWILWYTSDGFRPKVTNFFHFRWTLSDTDCGNLLVVYWTKETFTENSGVYKYISHNNNLKLCLRSALVRTVFRVERWLTGWLIGECLIWRSMISRTIDWILAITTQFGTSSAVCLVIMFCVFLFQLTANHLKQKKSKKTAHSFFFFLRLYNWIVCITSCVQNMSNATNSIVSLAIIK